MSFRERSVVILFSVGIAGFLLAGCAGSSSSGGTLIAPLKRAAPTPGKAASSAPGSSTGTSGRLSQGVTRSGEVGETIAPAAPLVIRSGKVALKVARGHVVDIFNSVSSAAESLGGFVASSSGSGSEDSAGASLVVRVPSSRFETLVGLVDKLGKVEAQSENGQDVTAESVNLSARIANLQAEETSLRALLSRAGSIAAILQVQDQLFGVEGDIEQLSAQEGSLIDQATFATLTVGLRPEGGSVTRRTKRGHENSFLRAVRLAAHNSAVAARAVVLAVGWAFPFLVLAVVILGAWWARRRMTRRRAPLPSTPGVS